MRRSPQALPYVLSRAEGASRRAKGTNRLLRLHFHFRASSRQKPRVQCRVRDTDERDEASFRDREYLALFRRVTELLGQSLDYAETLRNVAQSAVTTIADVCIVVMGDAGSAQMVAAAHRDKKHSGDFGDINAYLKGEDNRPDHPVRQVLESGSTFFASSIDARWIAENASSREHAEFMSRMQYTSMIVAPLVSNVYGPIGTLTLATIENGRAPFDKPAVEFAEALARMSATAIAKARLYTDAHATATTFQRAALPHAFPDLPGIRFFSYYRPATKNMLVGGDWYDAFLLPDGRLGICVGDVAGHGLEASVLMGSMRNAIRTALLMQPDISKALDAVDYLLRTEYGMPHFCTAMLGILDPEALTLRIAPAGHPGPKIWDADRAIVIDPFTERDLPLGFRNLSGDRAMPHTVRLARGSVVVFYTDGLIEGTREPLRGDHKLESILAQRDVRNAPDTARAVVDGMNEFANPDDDVAVLAVRVH